MREPEGYAASRVPSPESRLASDERIDAALGDLAELEEA